MTKETKIGVIAVATVLVFYIGINYLKGKNIFTRTNEYYVVYDNVSGLLESGRVQIKGFQIGEVYHIYYDENKIGKIVVSLRINKKIAIPRKSVARIFSVDLLGSKAIEFRLSNSDQYYKSGDTISGEVEMAVMDQIEPIKQQAENVLKAIDSLVNSFSIIFDEKSIREIKSSIADIKLSTASIARASSRLDIILSKTEDISFKINRYSALLDTTLTNFSNLSDSLATAPIKSTMIEMKQTIAEINQTVKSVNEGKGLIGKLATSDSLYNNLNNSALHLDYLIKDIQKNPNHYVRFSIFGKK